MSSSSALVTGLSGAVLASVPAIATYAAGYSAQARSAYGPDGNVWLTDPSANTVQQITPLGAISAYTMPTVAGEPVGVAAGPDGNLWIVEQNANKIARLATNGTFNEYAIPTGASSSIDIAAGSDGNLWFTECGSDKIGRVTTGGGITEYPTPGATVGQLAVAPDGNLWFAEYNPSRVGRITPSGVITEFDVGLPVSAYPYTCIIGPGGIPWIGSFSGMGPVTQ